MNALLSRNCSFCSDKLSRIIAVVLLDFAIGLFDFSIYVHHYSGEIYSIAGSHGGNTANL